MKKKATFISIGIIICIVIFFALDGIMDKNEDKTKDMKVQSEEIKKEKNALKDGFVDAQTKENPNIAKIDTEIVYGIQKGIKEKIDYQKFQKEFFEYVEYNKLLTDDTKAVCDGILLEDFEHNYVSFDLRLNNHANTLITVVYHGNGNFEFTH